MNDDMKFVRQACRALAQVSGMAMMVFWLAGHSYMTEGYGLHPAISGAGFVLALILPWILNEERI
jgi:hypothetical protein